MCLGMGSPTSYTLFDIGYRLSKISGKKCLIENWKFIGTLLQNFEDFISIFGNQLFDHNISFPL